MHDAGGVNGIYCLYIYRALRRERWSRQPSDVCACTSVAVGAVVACLLGLAKREKETRDCSVRGLHAEMDMGCDIISQLHIVRRMPRSPDCYVNVVTI